MKNSRLEGDLMKALDLGIKVLGAISILGVIGVIAMFSGFLPLTPSQPTAPAAPNSPKSNHLVSLRVIVQPEKLGITINAGHDSYLLTHAPSHSQSVLLQKSSGTLLSPPNL